MSSIPEQDRLRVVHAVLQLDTGGMEKLLVEFARHADRARFNLHFLSLTSAGPVADEIRSLGWPVTALGMKPGLRPSFVLGLAKFLRTLKADVLHAHNGKPAIYCGPAARLAGVKRVLYTRHGQRHQSRRRQDWLLRLASRCLDHVVCVSQDSARLAAREGMPAEKLVTVWNGIDMSRFDYTGPTPRGPAVMVGRLSPEKDVQTLIRALSIVVREEPQFRLLVAGAGPCLDDLRRLAAELGVSEHVRFLGRVDDIPPLLATASMSVLPSLTEGISLTLLEAMSSGLPVVATGVGGNPEVVSKGDTGLLVPPANPAVMAEAILEIWRNPDLSRQMGLAGRHRVERHFEARRMVATYELLYCGQPPAEAQACAAVPLVRPRPQATAALSGRTQCTD